MKPNLFGTDGIRAIVGKEPLTVTTLPRLGHALARWAKAKYKKNPSILLAHDTRSSCYFIKAALKSSLLLHKIKLYDVLALPTPTACLLIRNNKLFDCGIVITASHNPAQYNGIKIVDSKGNKIGQEDEEIITALCHEEREDEHYDSFGTDYRVMHAGAHYLDILCKHFNQQFLTNKTIVLDCANGAASSLVPHIFRMFGAKVITINDAPNGTNINKECGALHPEQLQKAVVEHHADAGFAFDGDADRVVAVSRDGNVKDGDDILALLMTHKKFADIRGIVGTHYSNQGLERFVLEQGKVFFRADVGDKYVMNKLTTEQLPLGGEPAGHIIDATYLESSDGTYIALLLLETLEQTNNWEMKSFNRYPQVLINVPISIKKDLQSEPLAAIIQEGKQSITDGRLVIRYSGTENVIRIMLEASQEEQAQSVGASLAKKLGKALTL